MPRSGRSGTTCTVRLADRESGEHEPESEIHRIAADGEKTVIRRYIRRLKGVDIRPAAPKSPRPRAFSKERHADCRIERSRNQGHRGGEVDEERQPGPHHPQQGTIRAVPAEMINVIELSEIKKPAFK